ncbi:MAG: efflux RND transporter periplasmic adaptor subunit [Acidobacteria bacterium]|nr:efflux RND transporter periplasmic adaptor subunit [Acidobacteriota bacterium]
MRSSSTLRVDLCARLFPGIRLCAAVLLAASVTAVAACGAGRGAPAPQQMPATLVQVAPVQSTSIDEASTYVATIQSLSSTSIKPEVSGEVTRILVRSGDRVGPGTPLFEIDPSRQQASVTSQDAARAAQDAAVIFAGQQLDRAKTLLAAGASSQQELDQAQANYDAALAQLSSLKARLQQERVTLKYYEVDAPAAGTVGDVPIRVGMHVTSDTVLTTIDLNQALEVYVPVALDRSRDLKLGLPVQVLDSQGALLASARVTFISTRVDDQTQSILVKARLAGDGRLRSSQLVRARIVWRQVEALAIPVLSVVRINGQPFVFVAQEKNGRLVASQRQVQLAQTVDNNVVVTSGLAPGDRIVVSGVQKLDNGVPIRTS